jgi:4'-phosphopantetheinyl transferase
VKNEDIGWPDRGPSIEITRLDGNCLLESPSTTLLPSEIHVWEFPLEIPEPAFSSFTKLLNEEERTRAARFHFERDAKRFSVARGSVRAILSGYVHSPAAELRFITTDHGKPAIVDSSTDIRFSISHSGEWGMLAVAREREVGVDIEIMRDNVEVDKLAERFFSPQERDSLRSLPVERKLPVFFRCWTCKEAFLKAQGVGLSRSLGSFDIDLNAAKPRLLATRPDARETERWSVFELTSVPGYAAAAATEGTVPAIQMFQCR